MVQLSSEVVESKEPLEGQIYIIENTEMIHMNVQQYNGLRVEMTDTKEEKLENKQKYATMLWMRDEASQNSKLGSFLQSFKKYFDGKTVKDKKGVETNIDYQDTDNWLNHTIKFVKWQNKSREIQIVK